jgi:hypothetical protein
MKTNHLLTREKMLAAGMMGYLVILFILFSGKEVIAQRSLPTTDPFNYSTGALHLVGQDWIRTSGTSNDLLVVDGNVTSNGYLGAVGRKASMTNGASDDLKLSFTAQNAPGTTVFSAFTIQLANTTGLTASGTYCFILGSGSNNFAARVFIKLSGSGYLLGISKTTTAPAVWSTVLPVGVAQLIVVGYEIKAGNSNDIASLWINPPITTIPPSPGFSASAGTDFGGGSAIDGFILRQATGTPNVSLDDITISTSWSDLMQNPVFTSSGFLGEGTYDNLTVSGLATALTLIGNVIVQNDLTIADGSVVTVNPALPLSVEGNSELNGEGCLVLKSDATGTGSFIDNGITAIGSALIIERFLTGYGNTNDKRYHFLSSPVEGQPIQPSFVETPPDPLSDFYLWDEVTGYWINSKVGAGGWNGGFDPVFGEGKGYLVAYPSSGTKMFTGLPNSYSASSPLVLNCSHTDPASGGGGGWNLLGNPFPSPIDWTMVGRGNGMDAALYYYDAEAENYRYYIEYQPGVALGNGSQYIPSMQGFMVHAGGAGDRYVSFGNDCRVHAGNNLYYKRSEEMPPHITLKVDNGVRSDESFIYFVQEAKEGFDPFLDAFKLSGNNFLTPALYSMTHSGEKLAINALPDGLDAYEIALGFQPGSNGEYTITIEGHLPEMGSRRLELKDLQTGRTQILTQNPVYSFSATTLDDPARFQLLYSPANYVTLSEDPSSIRVFSKDGRIIVSAGGRDKCYNIELFTVTGALVYSEQLQIDAAITLPNRFQPGIYLARLSNGEQQVTKKVVVH